MRVSLANWCRRRISRIRLGRSRCAVGSSSMRIGVSCARARASMTFWLCPSLRVWSFRSRNAADTGRRDRPGDACFIGCIEPAQPARPGISAEGYQRTDGQVIAAYPVGQHEADLPGQLRGCPSVLPLDMDRAMQCGLETCRGSGARSTYPIRLDPADRPAVRAQAAARAAHLQRRSVSPRSDNPSGGRGRLAGKRRLLP